MASPSGAGTSVDPAALCHWTVPLPRVPRRALPNSTLNRTSLMVLASLLGQDPDPAGPEPDGHLLRLGVVPHLLDQELEDPASLGWEQLVPDGLEARQRRLEILLVDRLVLQHCQFSPQALGALYGPCEGFVGLAQLAGQGRGAWPALPDGRKEVLTFLGKPLAFLLKPGQLRLEAGPSGHRARRGLAGRTGSVGEPSDRRGGSPGGA